jgi:hypothetical protein
MRYPPQMSAQTLQNLCKLLSDAAATATVASTTVAGTGSSSSAPNKGTAPRLNAVGGRCVGEKLRKKSLRVGVEGMTLNCLLNVNCVCARECRDNGCVVSL